MQSKKNADELFLLGNKTREVFKTSRVKNASALINITRELKPKPKIYFLFKFVTFFVL